MEDFCDWIFSALVLGLEIGDPPGIKNAKRAIIYLGFASNSSII